MNKKDLIDLGIAEDVAEKVIVMHGKDIESKKSALDSLTTERDTFKKSLDDATKQIESFKGMDIEGVKKSADDWKTKAEAAQKEAADQIAAVKFEHALESGLTGAKVKYSKEVLARLKLDELKDKDGNFIPERFETQIKTVKESASDLFESDAQTPEIVLGGGNKPVSLDAITEAARNAAGLPPTKG